MTCRTCPKEINPPKRFFCSDQCKSRWHNNYQPLGRMAQCWCKKIFKVEKPNQRNCSPRCRERKKEQRKRKKRVQHAIDRRFRAWQEEQWTGYV